MSPQVDDYISQNQSQIENILTALESTYQKTGFDGTLIGEDSNINYNLVKDDFSGEYSLEGVWNYANGYRQGMFLIHPDGSFFAEYDVVKPHPQKTKWFVEAITAWGKESTIKTEPRLIPAV